MTDEPRRKPRSGRPHSFLPKWDVPILIIFIGIPMLAVVSWISIAALGDWRDEVRVRELTGQAPGMVGRPLEEVFTRHRLPTNSFSVSPDEWSHMFLIADRRRDSDIQSTWLCLNVDENGMIAEAAVETR